MAVFLFGLSLLTCIGHVAFQTIWAVGIGGKPFNPTPDVNDVLLLFGFQKYVSAISPHQTEQKFLNILSFAPTLRADFSTCGYLH